MGNPVQDYTGQKGLDETHLTSDLAKGKIQQKIIYVEKLF